MTTKHTPGPWNWHGPYMGGAYKASGLNEQDLTMVDIYITGDNAHSDACLIAAAPELLAALERFIDPRELTTHEAQRNRLDQARAALSRAKGEA